MTISSLFYQIAHKRKPLSLKVGLFIILSLKVIVLL